MREGCVAACWRVGAGTVVIGAAGDWLLGIVLFDDWKAGGDLAIHDQLQLVFNPKKVHG
jgi:hypothetical protein